MQSRHGKKFYLLCSAQIHPQTSKPTERANEMMKTSGGRGVCYFQSTTHSSGPGKLLFLTADRMRREKTLFPKQTSKWNYKRIGVFFSTKIFDLEICRKSCWMKLSVSESRTQFYQSIALPRHRFTAAAKINFASRLFFISSNFATSFHRLRSIILADGSEKVTPAPHRTST